MKKLCVICCLILSNLIFGCGGGYWYEEDLFYNVFYSKSTDFTSDFEVNYEIGHSENLKLWEELLEGWSGEDINTVLFSSNDEEFESKWEAGTTTSLEYRAYKYLKKAREISNQFKSIPSYSWDYDEIISKRLEIASEIDEEELILLMESEKNKQLRARYLYQIIRVLHYSEQYNKGIEYFEKHKKNIIKDEIYYYILDQVAGCYFSQNQYEKGAYLFLQVFVNSEDRRPSAFNSYGYCLGQGANGKTLLKTKKDSLDFLQMSASMDFDDKLSLLDVSMNLDPNSKLTKYFFQESIRNIEATVWPKSIHEVSELPSFSAIDSYDIKELKKHIKSAINNSQVEDKGYWYLANSYLHFLSGEADLAKQGLRALDNKTKTDYQNQIQSLSKIYEVFTWKELDKNKEDTFLSLLTNSLLLNDYNNYYDYDSKGLQYLLMTQVSHLYYGENKLAQSFLMFHSTDRVKNIRSIELIDALIDFKKRKNKSNLEQELVKKIKSTDDLYYFKCVLQIKNHNLRSAFKTEARIKNSSKFSDFSLLLFGSTMVERYDSYEEDLLTLPQTKLLERKSGNVSFKDLISTLKRLDKLIHSGNESEKYEASLLLGNFYANVSNYGYFRGVFEGASNCCNSYYINGGFYYSDKAKAIHELIEDKEGYNLDNIDVIDLDFGLGHVAYAYYKEALNHSSNKEEKAKLWFKLAKSAWMTSGGSDGYYYTGNEPDSYSDNHKNAYNELMTTYKDTKYYQEIINECSYFRIYCNYSR